MVPRHFHGRFRQQSRRRAAAAAPLPVLAEAHCAPSHGNPQEHTKQQFLGTPYISTEARSVDPDTLMVYKAPRVVQFVGTLPKSGTGKVMRRTLQEAEPQ